MKATSAIEDRQKLNQKRTPRLNRWSAIMSYLLMGCAVAVLGDERQCPVSKNRSVTCYSAKPGTSPITHVCHCCLPILDGIPNDENDNEYFCKTFHPSAIQFRINLMNFTFNDVIQIPKDPYFIEIYFSSLKVLMKNTFTNIRTLEKLTVQGPNIFSIEPLAFEDLPYLTILNISYTSLKFIIDNAFDYTPSLSELILKNNKIFTILPNNFKNAPNMRSLILAENQISSLTRESFLGLNQLEILDLSHNDIKNLSSELFSCLKAVKIINLAYNSITLLNENSFRGLNQLRQLSLIKNFIKGIPRTMLSKCPNVDHLNLKDNQSQCIVYLNELCLHMNTSPADLPQSPKDRKNTMISPNLSPLSVNITTYRFLMYILFLYSLLYLS